MRETAYQTGDAARYASTFAGAQAALKTQTKQLSSALGSIFAPALQAIMPYLTAIAEKLTALATRAGQVMAVLFGIKPTPIKQLAASSQAASAGMEKAAKKAKELKGQLLGIDELNVIEKSDTSDSGGDASGSTGGTSTESPISSALSDADNVIDPRIKERAEEIREKLEPIVSIMDKIKDVCLVVYDVAIKPFMDAVAPKVRQQIEKITAKWSELIKKIESSKIYQDFIEIVKRLGPPIEKWCELLASITASLGGMAYELYLNSIDKKIKDIEDAIGLVSALIQGDFSDAWEHLKNLLWDNKIDRAKEELRILGDTFSEVKTAIKDWVDYWRDKISEFMNSWKEKITAWWDEDVKPWFTVEKWEEILFNIGVGVGNAVNNMREAWKANIVPWWNDDVKPWLSLERWKEAFGDMVSAMRNKWKEFKQVWTSNISSWWQNNVQPWLSREKWRELGENMKNGIVSGFKAAISSIAEILNKIIGGVENLINGIASGINKIIDGYNSVTLGKKIPEFPHWDAWKFPEPRWYAKGGVFTDRSIIGVGEYPGAASNPEIATPQSIMRDTVAGVLQSDRSNQYDVIYRAVYSALSALGPDLFSPEVVLEMDSRVCGRATAKYVKQELVRASEW